MCQETTITMIEKSLKSISWDVPEDIYRQDDALSYSTLAKYERSGFNGLATLFDRVESPSLTFGSMVDEMITGSMESFNERFLVAEYPQTPDSIIQIVKKVFEQEHDISDTLYAVPDTTIIRIASEFNYQNNWKPETRAKVIKEKGAEYYNLLYISTSKTIVTSQDYQDACNAVQALKGSEATHWYFEEDNPFSNIERLYQLKFKATLRGINFRCMADLIIVDHYAKLIQPCDLKTSGKPEWDFFKSFVDWDYQIQARLYWRIIKDCISKDPYFKDFTLMPYRFIVVNRKTLSPLVWQFEDTDKEGPLTYGRQSQIVLRDPFEIANELHTYLEYKCDTPIGIFTNEHNSLEHWLNTM